MDENIKYAVWLQKCLGAASKKLHPAIKAFNSPKEIYLADENDLRNTGIFSEGEIEKLKDKDNSYSLGVMEVCAKAGYGIIPYGSKEYPERLAQISTPPIVLYVLGSIPDDECDFVGMVGTRNPDESGKQLAYNFAYDLSENNKVIVSGGAYGIDYFSHKGCTDASGRTVCVLGCGIDRLNTKIKNYILSIIPQKGAVISEYPPGYPPTNFTFPLRNRIISGMSDCTLIVQAGLGSGALITVRYAIEQNKKIFSVPGDMSNIYATGTNYLISRGFSTALSYKDISDWYDKSKNNNGKYVKENPQTDIHLLEFLSIRADEHRKKADERNSIRIPIGYDFFSFQYSNNNEENDVYIQAELFEEQTQKKEMELSNNNEEINEIKNENKSKDKDIDNDKKIHKEKSQETKKAIPDNSIVIENNPDNRSENDERNLEIKLLNELKERALKDLPEPSDSIILKKAKNSNASVQYLRLMKIDELSRKLKKKNGLYIMTSERMSELFRPSEGIDQSNVNNGPRSVSIPDLNFFDEESTEEYEINRLLFNPSEKTNKSKLKFNNSDKKTEENLPKSIDKNNYEQNEKEYVRKKNNDNNKKNLSEQLTENAFSVYDTISDTPVHVDSIKLSTNLSIGEVLSSLTELQILGLVRKLPGGRYVRN